MSAQDHAEIANAYLQIVAEYPNKTDTEIAGEMGVSQSRLSTIRTKMGLSTLVAKCRKYGVNPTTVSSYWIKDKHISLNVKNANIVTYEDIRDDMIKTMSEHSPKYSKIKYPKSKNPHLLVVDPADIHIGKLAIQEESNDVYNTDIAIERVMNGVTGLITQSSGFNLDKILLVIGNDVLHVDNRNKTTTSGTPQDVDGSMWKAYKSAQAMYVEVIEHLVQTAPVHVVHNPGNHDRVSGSLLADSLMVWFKNNKNVTFDTDMRLRKYYQYGNNMIVTSHGDGIKPQDFVTLVAGENPEMWGKTKFRYGFLHHIHHKKAMKWVSGQDYHGFTVEYLRSPSGTDYWHSQKGYTSMQKAVEGFIHSPELGRVATLTVNLE